MEVRVSFFSAVAEQPGQWPDLLFLVTVPTTTGVSGAALPMTDTAPLAAEPSASLASGAPIGFSDQYSGQRLDHSVE